MKQEIKYTKLPEEFKTKWLVALRSGEYRQAQGYLYNPESGGYCCLGVAEAVCGTPISDLEGISVIANSHAGSCMIPSQVRTPVELHDPELQGKLACMNDGGSMSFLDIANWIEQNI